MAIMGFQHGAVAFESDVLARAALRENPIAAGLLQAAANGRFRAARAGIAGSALVGRITWTAR